MSEVPAQRGGPLLTGIRTECHECWGRGWRPAPYCALAQGELWTKVTGRVCPTCKGAQWLPGFVPPV